ncbi:MAG: OmpA family protein [Bacteroidota bacterium]
MKHLSFDGPWSRSVWFGTLVFFVLSACTFPKAVQLAHAGNLDAAEEKFNKTINHRTYGQGAEGYLARIEARRTNSTVELLYIIDDLCRIEEEIGRLPLKKARKLRKHDAGAKDFRIARNTLQQQIFDTMAVKGTITELVYLEEHADCWSEDLMDSLRTIVVNKNINPQQSVFSSPLDALWVGTPAPLPSFLEVRAEPSRSCQGLGADRSLTLTYAEVNEIIDRYTEVILPQNYRAFFQIKEDIWTLFQWHEPYCKMDEFKQAHPFDPVSTDCWFDKARDTLCLGELRPLLAFHRNNRHTALDVDIAYQIVCLSTTAADAGELTPTEREQLADVIEMLDLWGKATCCRSDLDPAAHTLAVARLAEKYTQHDLIFELIKATVRCYASRGLADEANAAIAVFRPLCPDASVCIPEFVFQVGKQAWLDLAQRDVVKLNLDLLPQPMVAWNTVEGDERSLVSWGGTKEVFFVREDRASGKVEVMTSVLKNEKWSTPSPVAALSVSYDVELLSMSGDGRQLLLKAGGQLLQALRPEVGRAWLPPALFPMSDRWAGSAWISPDDSMMIVNYYQENLNLKIPNLTNMAAMKLAASGRYGVADPLGETVNNSFDNEGSATMALGGRLLLYTSDSDYGLGGIDLWSASLSRPYDWGTLDKPRNLGVLINSPRHDAGISYFSEYSGLAYLHRAEPCSDNQDIYSLRLGPGVFPANALRVAGLVIDENEEPIGGGFMEFTANYNLHVHSEAINEEGTYNYTVADSTDVVRLFPEIPGYYSERDTTHYIAQAAEGEILRDTFRLTSFEYLRQNFRLRRATFRLGTAEFDQPDATYVELNRLAKIATRMGADIQLNGHSDNVGDRDQNRRLSLARATSVKRFLVNRCGFAAARIFVAGLGDTQPLCTEDTDDCRSRNRRIEVIFKMPELE